VHVPESLITLAVLFATALLSAWLLNRLQQPPLIGYLLAGALVGPAGLGFVKDRESIETLAEIGVMLLLFTIGLELSLGTVRKLGRVVWIAGPIQLVGTIAVATLFALLRGRSLGSSIFFGFLISLSSTAIVLKLLHARGELDAPYGRLLIGILILQDLAVVPMMLAIPYLAGTAGGMGLSGVALALVKTAGAAVLIFVAARWLVPRLLRVVAGTGQKEIFIIAVLCLVVGTALASNAAGLSLALGAFLAGLVLSETDYGHQAMADVAPFRDAFNALFFVSVGMLFDARILLSQPLGVALAVATTLIAKSVFGALPALLSGYGVRVAVIVGVTLAQVGEFSFVLLQAGQELGLVPADVYQIFLAASILTMVATPFLHEASHALSEHLPGSRWGEKRRLSESGLMLPLMNHVVILGFGHMGETLAGVLLRGRVPFRVLDLNPERVRHGARRGIPVEYGDVTSDLVLREAGIETARAVIVVLSDPRSTRTSIRLCRSLNAGTFLLARTRYLRDVPELTALGADDVIAEEFETSLEIAGRVLRRLGLPMPWIESETEALRSGRHDGFRRFRAPGASPEEVRRALGGTRVEFISVGSDWKAVGRTLREIEIRAGGGAVILAVVRQGLATVAPDDDFGLDPGDQVLLLGTEETIDRSVELLRGAGWGTESRVVSEGVGEGT
jgi:CPA2 family monovalent cation:H+ antiporter-2